MKHQMFRLQLNKNQRKNKVVIHLYFLIILLSMTACKNESKFIEGNSPNANSEKLLDIFGGDSTKIVNYTSSSKIVTIDISKEKCFEYYRNLETLKVELDFRKEEINSLVKVLENINERFLNLNFLENKFDESKLKKFQNQLLKIDTNYNESNSLNEEESKLKFLIVILSKQLDEIEKIQRLKHESETN